LASIADVRLATEPVARIVTSVVFQPESFDLLTAAISDEPPFDATPMVLALEVVRSV